jgi:hypothetical protein
LSALAADDFELIRPHLKTADLLPDSVLVGAGQTLRHAWMPHRGVISLIVNLSKGGHVQIAMIGATASSAFSPRSAIPSRSTARWCWCPASPRPSSLNGCMPRPIKAPRCGR